MKNNLIDEKWLQFWSSLSTKEKDPDIIGLTGLSFFAGAVAMYSLLKYHTEDFLRSDGKTAEVLKSIEAEIKTFGPKTK